MRDLSKSNLNYWYEELIGEYWQIIPKTLCSCEDNSTSYLERELELRRVEYYKLRAPIIVQEKEFNLFGDENE